MIMPFRGHQSFVFSMSYWACGAMLLKNVTGELFPLQKSSCGFRILNELKRCLIYLIHISKATWPKENCDFPSCLPHLPSPKCMTDHLSRGITTPPFA